MSFVPSVRAQVVTRRTYNRPIDDEGTQFENWDETIDRVISHQRWLWETAAGRKLTKLEEIELEELRALFLDRAVLPAGRTLWLGGTDIAKTRCSSQFNCSGSAARTVYDVVDHLWLLLQGAGVSHIAEPGVLSGFAKPVDDIEVVRSQITMDMWKQGFRGAEHNKEEIYEDVNGKKVWHLTVGDSAEAWAKSIGKILAMKKPVNKIILDFSEIRPAGVRLKGYGWISSGDEQIAVAYTAICKILSRKADQLLNRIDILDIENWLATALSSRRAAELVLCPADDPEWEDFALAKRDYWSTGNVQRAQSNNSLLFNEKPSKAELYGIFSLMQMAGGSDPGFINGEAARKRAPWFKLVNP